jgi:hypothetical protein
LPSRMEGLTPRRSTAALGLSANSMLIKKNMQLSKFRSHLLITLVIFNRPITVKIMTIIVVFNIIKITRIKLRKSRLIKLLI